MVTLKGEVQIFKDFQQVTDFPTFEEYNIVKCFDGPLLGLQTAEGDFLFVDWESGYELKSFELNSNRIIWSKNEELMLIYTEEENGYILEYNKDLIQQEQDDDESEFLSVLYEFNDSVMSGEWVGDVFLYSLPKVNYHISLVEAPLLLPTLINLSML